MIIEDVCRSEEEEEECGRSSAHWRQMLGELAERHNPYFPLNRMHYYCNDRTKTTRLSCIRQEPGSQPGKGTPVDCGVARLLVIQTRSERE